MLESKVSFLGTTDELSLSAKDSHPPFESIAEEDHHDYLTLFDDHLEWMASDKSSIHPEDEEKGKLS